MTSNKAFAVGAPKFIKKHTIDIKLPTECVEADDDFNAYALLIHGEKKIGKTSLSLQREGDILSGEGVLLLQLDPRQIGRRRMEIHIPDWRTYLAVQKKLDKSPTMYDRVVIDGADRLYRMCTKYVCEKKGIEHPDDEPYGKGYDWVRQEFTEAVQRFLALECGRWVLCHSKWIEVEDRHGDTTSKLVPHLTNTCNEILNGLFDASIAYDYEQGERILILLADEHTSAGHRMDDESNPHFRSKGGDRIRYIRAGHTAKRTFDRLVRAFNNQLEDKYIVTEDEILTSRKSASPSKSKSKKG